MLLSHEQTTFEIEWTRGEYRVVEAGITMARAEELKKIFAQYSSRIVNEIRFQDCKKYIPGYGAVVGEGEGWILFNHLKSI